MSTHDGDTCESVDADLDLITGELNDTRMALVRSGVPPKWLVDGEVQNCPTPDMVRDLHAQRDRLHAFAWWLIEMDHPEIEAGMARRKTVTLTQITDRARDALSAATEHNHPARDA